MSDIFESKRVFSVEEVKRDFNYWLGKPYISESLREKLLSANVLIVPYENYRENLPPVFPLATEDLYQELVECNFKGIVADLCIEDEDYKEIALHSDLLIIGSFVVTAFVAPIFVNVISDYINRKIRDRKKDLDVRIEMTIINQREGKSHQIKYEGPFSQFDKVISTVKSITAKEDDKSELGNSEE